ncbi:MAG: protein kinase [Gemmatimonadetes bacterium]|nr:protein kinase [Gemmatimonadota bacterium]
MMRPLSLSIVIAASMLQLSACDHGIQDESAAATARDSSLAHDLRLASDDTAPLSDAADVAVAGRSDSVPRMVEASSAPRSPATRVASNKSTVIESPGALGTPATSRAARAAPTRSVPAPAASSASSKPSASIKPTASSKPTASKPSASSKPSKPSTTSTTSTTTEDSPSAEAFAGASCASPAMADQRRCLMSYLARSDVALDRNYLALITALKREAGTSSGGAEPATVMRLRTAQRNWVVFRDDACRKRNEGKEGPLWAPTRAQCLAEYSGQRAKELANALATRTSTSAVNAKPAPAKRSKHVVSRRPKHRRS